MMFAAALALAAADPRLAAIDRRLAIDRAALVRADAPMARLLATVQRLLLASPGERRDEALQRDAVLVRILQAASASRTAALRADLARLAGERAELAVRDSLRRWGMRPSPIGHVVPIVHCEAGAFRLPVESVALTPRAAAALGHPRGLTLVALPGAAVVAPAGGRVAYAGGFRRYGGVVILNHGHGWTTLLTGLDGVTARTNRTASAGEVVGRVGRAEPLVTVEIRRHGRMIDPRAMLRRCPRERAGARAFPPGPQRPT